MKSKENGGNQYGIYKSLGKKSPCQYGVPYWYGGEVAGNIAGFIQLIVYVLLAVPKT